MIVSRISRSNGAEDRHDSLLSVHVNKDKKMAKWSIVSLLAAGLVTYP